MAERLFSRSPSPGFRAQVAPPFPSGRTFGPVSGAGRRPPAPVPGLPLVAGPPPQPTRRPPTTQPAGRGALKQAFPMPAPRQDDPSDIEALLVLLDVLASGAIGVLTRGRAGAVRRTPTPSPPRKNPPVTQKQINDAVFGRTNLPQKAGPRRVLTREIQRREARKRLARIGITGALAGVLLRSSTRVPTIPEVVVTPKARTVDLTKLKPKAPTPSTPPKVTIGTIRKLFPWLAAPIFATLLRPKIRVQTPSGRVRDAETLSDIPLPTNVAVPLLTGFPLTQTQPRRVSSRDCQIVQRRRRRKGKCREGFFRERPGSTKYITWRTRKCR